MDCQVSVVIEFPTWARAIGQADPQELLLRLFHVGHVDEIIIRAMGVTPILKRADGLPPAIMRALEAKADEVVITIPLSPMVAPDHLRNVVERIAELGVGHRVVAWKQDISIVASYEDFDDQSDPTDMPR